MAFSASGTGQTRVRMPVELHEQLIRESEQQGVSLNVLVVSLLAGAIGFELKEETPR